MYSVIPVSVNKNTPFARAFALQRSSINRSPDPDSVFSRLIFPRLFLSGGVFFLFTDTGISSCSNGHLYICM